MKLSIIQVLVAALVAPLSAQAGLSESAVRKSSEAPVAAIVSKDGRPMCVAFTQAASDALVEELLARASLPVCNGSNSDSSQIQAAFEMGAKGDSTKVAFFSYAGAAFVGCVYGILSPMMGQMVGSALGNEKGTTENFAVGSIAGAGVGAVSLVGLLTAGHSWALAGGYVACTGGLNYMLYREKNAK